MSKSCAERDDSSDRAAQLRFAAAAALAFARPAQHLVFLPTLLEDVADPKRIAVHACEFRRRLAPDKADDHWWPYGTTDRDAASSVDHLVTTYTTVGVPELERYRSFPEPFSMIAPSSLTSHDLTALPGPTTVARAALAMARISVHLGLAERARDFIRVGLEDLDRGPAGGLAIRRQLLHVEGSLDAAG